MTWACRWKPLFGGALLGACLVIGVSGLALAQSGSGSAGERGREGYIPPEAHVCLGCHTVRPSAGKGAGSGPPLWEVVGRSPSVEGAEVSRWTSRALDRWLANPRAMAPGTRSRFPGYADPAMRAAVIRFLEQLH